MIVWTMQPLSALDELEKAGTFRCERSKSFNLTKQDSLELPYQWLMERMEEKIGAAPGGVEYPIWAWHTWEFKRERPNPDSAAFLRRDEGKVFFTLDIPENQLLLSDFDAWQAVMMGTYVADAQTEEEFEALSERLDSLPEEALQEEIHRSWENVFLTDLVDTDFITRGKYIQATFWEIRKEYVRAAEILHGKL